MKKIYDLFDFNEVEIKTRTDSYDHVYTATLKKHMTFEMYDERGYLPTKEEWIEKAKETFVKKIISDDFINKCDEDDAKYFTDLKNAIESTGLVDQFLWDRGYKRIGSTWQPQSISQKQSKMENKKQSSVDWLYDTIDDEIVSYLDGEIDLNELSIAMLKIKEQAKAMHREEIEDTFFESAYGGDIISGEQYYTNTFGGQDNE